MTDIYLPGEQKKRQRGWLTRWAARILLLVLSGLILYAYIRVDMRLSAIEQAQPASGEQASDRCAWLPLVRAQRTGSQTCPAGSYVKGVGISYDDGFREPYPLRYRLYCCALVSGE